MLRSQGNHGNKNMILIYSVLRSIHLAGQRNEKSMTSDRILNNIAIANFEVHKPENRTSI